jgi:hypothetical protein
MYRYNGRYRYIASSQYRLRYNRRRLLRRPPLRMGPCELPAKDAASLWAARSWLNTSADAIDFLRDIGRQRCLRVNRDSSAAPSATSR